MSVKVTMVLKDEDHRLAVAHAADRGLKVAQLARTALLGELKRHAARTGLLREVERIVDERLSRLAPRGERRPDGQETAGPA